MTFARKRIKVYNSFSLKTFWHPGCPVWTSGRDWEIRRADSVLQLQIQHKDRRSPWNKGKWVSLRHNYICLSFFKAAGVEIYILDIDIAHRTLTRNATPGPRPVVCKFTWRISTEKVKNVRKDACKVTASSIGWPADCTLKNAKLFDNLTPQVQQLLADTKIFQTRDGFRFLWC